MTQREKHILATALSVLCSVLLFWESAESVLALPIIEDTEVRTEIAIDTNGIPNWPQGPEVSAQAAILMDAGSGAILYAKNIHEQLYPASTTKILTCLIAAERCSMDEVVTFSHDAIFDNPPGSSGIALDEGEELSVEQCLNAILIASANEAAFGLAEHITGTSWRDFAQIMNERARELGCEDSHFVNPNGLPDEDHYTSAHDLAMIGRAFFANELLCKISSSQKLELMPTEKQPDHIVEYSRNQLFPGKPYAYEYLVGSKTGYTDAAKSTLVSCAEKDGLKLICVVMTEDSPAQFADTVALFNYGFNNFESVNISQTEERFNIDNANFFYGENDIFGNSEPILALNPDSCIVLPRTVSFAEIDSVITYDTNVEGQAALITYSYQGQYLGDASVDFAVSADAAYAFEDGVMQTSSGKDKKDGKEEQRIIFINVFKVLAWIIGTAVVLALAVGVYSLIANYHFEGREKNNRRSWMRDRRRKRGRFKRRR